MMRLEGHELRKLIPLCLEDDLITLSVLTGVQQGYALVDDADQPNQAFVFHAHYGFVNCIGNPPEDMQSIAHMVMAYQSDRPYFNVTDFINYPKGITPYIKENFARVYDLERIVYQHDQASFHDAPDPTLPTGVRIVPMSKEDFVDETIKNEVILFWDKAEDMLEHAFGVKALYHNNVIGLCYAIAAANNRLDIDIITYESHRKKGVGYAMAHAFITQCYATGKLPHWCCVSLNEPSVALAKKLGFKEARRFRQLTWIKE